MLLPAWWAWSGRPKPASRRLAVVAVACLFLSACAPSARPRIAPGPALAALSPSDELYTLSSARVQIRRLAPLGMRLLVPHWNGVREGDRRVLQATLVSTLSEERVAPFVRASLKRAVTAEPELAATVLAWLRSPVGYEVKFADATAWSGDKASEGAFYSNVAAVRENRAPEIRAEPLARLATATGALEKTLDLVTEVGTVVARLVNVSRPGKEPLTLAQLGDAIERERNRPETLSAYAPVVTAALMVRCRDLDLADLERYIEFSSSEAGRWYHDTMAAALADGIDGASMDVEGVLDANAHSDAMLLPVGGLDLDSLLVPLPSGREVRLLAYAQSGTRQSPGVVLRYETTLPMGNSAAVRREADEVWDKLRGQFESEGAHTAMLEATGAADGWVFPFASSRKFAWRRGQDGEWSVVASADGTVFGKVHTETLWSVPP